MDNLSDNHNTESAECCNYPCNLSHPPKQAARNCCDQPLEHHHPTFPRSCQKDAIRGPGVNSSNNGWLPPVINCRWCGGSHGLRCPFVQAFEYHPNGEISRVEFILLNNNHFPFQSNFNFNPPTASE
jgi:hypothetical protein